MNGPIYGIATAFDNAFNYYLKDALGLATVFFISTIISIINLKQSKLEIGAKVWNYKSK